MYNAGCEKPCLLKLSVGIDILTQGFARLKLKNLSMISVFYFLSPIRIVLNEKDFNAFDL